MMKRDWIARISRGAAFVCLLVILSACASARTNPAQGVVRRMYDALSKGDRDAYMDAILPENRQRGGYPLGLLDAFSFGIGPLNLDPSKLMNFTVKNLKVDLISSRDDYALVQASGMVRYPIIAMELNFCDQHDVRRIQDGNWYVDIYASERAERLQRIQAKRQQELAQTPSGSGGLDPFSMLKDLGPMMEKALDLCE